VSERRSKTVADSDGFLWEPDRNMYDIGGNYQLSEEEVEKKFIEM